MILDDFLEFHPQRGLFWGGVKAPSLAPICSLELEPISFFIFCQGLGNIPPLFGPMFFLRGVAPIGSQCRTIYMCKHVHNVYIYICVCV